MSPAPELHPRETYNGGYANAHTIKLRISNGAAGESGLIGAWANSFIQHCVKDLHIAPFLVAWYVGDTTQSLQYLREGSIDIAVTYNQAAETLAILHGGAAKRVYVFRDHFALVGPKSNPAELKEGEAISLMLNKIVTTGNRDAKTPPTSGKQATGFLSRYDKSATHIKDSELFISIGQAPWGLDYSKWYHQYPHFPHEALGAASVLGEYTLTDKGTILSSEKSIMDNLKVYKMGTDDIKDPLLDPAHALLGNSVADKAVADHFMSWVVSSAGGQAVVRHFKKGGVVLYSPAP